MTAYTATMEHASHEYGHTIPGRSLVSSETTRWTKGCGSQRHRLADLTPLKLAGEKLQRDGLVLSCLRIVRLAHIPGLRPKPSVFQIGVNGPR